MCKVRGLLMVVTYWGHREGSDTFGYYQYLKRNGRGVQGVRLRGMRGCSA